MKDYNIHHKSPCRIRKSNARVGILSGTRFAEGEISKSDMAHNGIFSSTLSKLLS